jgi:hypothetical protein
MKRKTHLGFHLLLFHDYQIALAITPYLFNVTWGLSIAMW